jgi:hypothetical protein
MPGGIGAGPRRHHSEDRIGGPDIPAQYEGATEGKLRSRFWVAFWACLLASRLDDTGVGQGRYDPGHSETGAIKQVAQFFRQRSLSGHG